MNKVVRTLPLVLLLSTTSVFAQEVQNVDETAVVVEASVEHKSTEEVQEESLAVEIKKALEAACAKVKEETGKAVALTQDSIKSFTNKVKEESKDQASYIKNNALIFIKSLHESKSPSEGSAEEEKAN